MSHNLSRHLLFFITRNKINLSFPLSITRNFFFFLPINQPTFFHPTFLFLTINQSTFLHLTLHKLSSFTSLQCPTRDGGMIATRLSIYITYHSTKDGGVAATRPSIHIAHHPTRDGSMAVTRPSIHIAHHLFSLVWSSWTLNIAF